MLRSFLSGITARSPKKKDCVQFKVKKDKKDSEEITVFGTVRGIETSERENKTLIVVTTNKIPLLHEFMLNKSNPDVHTAIFYIPINHTPVSYGVDYIPIKYAENHDNSSYVPTHTLVDKDYKQEEIEASVDQNILTVSTLPDVYNTVKVISCPTRKGGRRQRKARKTRRRTLRRSYRR
jgi:hypothetical protein